MKKSAILGSLAASFVILVWAILGLSSSVALAQATEETPVVATDTETPTPTLVPAVVRLGCALTRLLLAESASMTTSPTSVPASSPSASERAVPLAIIADVGPAA